MTLVIEKTVRCDEVQTFSSQYYTAQQRNMRLSRNLIVPTPLTQDIEDGGIRYELMYCSFDGLKYKVKNILKVKDTRHKMLLDIQEVR